MQITINKIVLEDIIKNLYRELFNWEGGDDSLYLEKKLIRAVGYKNLKDFIQQHLKNKEFMQELKSRLVKEIERDDLYWNGLGVDDFKSLRKLAKTVKEKGEEITQMEKLRNKDKDEK